MWIRRPRSKSLESQCIPVDLASMTTKACPHLVASRLQPPPPPEVATLGREGRKAQTCNEACSIRRHCCTTLCSLVQMYHTFTVTSPRVRTQANDGTEQPRISTTTACLECRRKKTRCGGGQPCQQCIGIERPELCKYARRARKTMPSRRCVQSVCLQAVSRD